MVAGDREGSLQADHSERSEVELYVLLVEVVGSMVGGDGVDGSVRNRLENRVAMQRSSEWRVHLQIRRERLHHLAGEREGTRGGRGRHLETTASRAGGGAERASRPSEGGGG